MIGKENFCSIILALGHNGVPKKPHPQGLYDCLNALGVEKHEAIFVGNADEDVMAAKNAGVFDIFLARGEHEFPDITPSLKIHSLYELRKFLKF
jgi:phosphoglycolate phosphatase-like HAD superfamily hydrolase